MEIELVPIEWLKPHEEIKPKKVDELASITKKWGCYTKPLLVDSETGTILDGHHRHQVGFQLNLKRLPVVLFDYLNDDSIVVEAWPNCGLEFLSKQEIIDMAASDQLYPPKTSRHTTEWNTPPIHISLETLAESEDSL
ncbi:MAG: ParB N-terminal domain-containing protein [Euryarchaeota archaeon]|nr:ParB N-terminal domain-containing protein [Euryarchaeota archaeon]